MQRHAHHTYVVLEHMVLQHEHMVLQHVVLEHIAEVLQHVVACSACCSMLHLREKIFNTTTHYNTLCCSAGLFLEPAVGTDVRDKISQKSTHCYSFFQKTLPG